MVFVVTYNAGPNAALAPEPNYFVGIPTVSTETISGQTYTYLTLGEKTAQFGQDSPISIREAHQTGRFIPKATIKINIFKSVRPYYNTFIGTSYENFQGGNVMDFLSKFAESVRRRSGGRLTIVNTQINDDLHGFTLRRNPSEGCLPIVFNVYGEGSRLANGTVLSRDIPLMDWKCALEILREFEPICNAILRVGDMWKDFLPDVARQATALYHSDNAALLFAFERRAREIIQATAPDKEWNAAHQPPVGASVDTIMRSLRNAYEDAKREFV